MTKPIVHMIGQGHLDPVWLWPWTEGRAEALATSQSAVDRLDEYADFHFVRGEAQIYRWIEEENPELFARIKVPNNVPRFVSVDSPGRVGGVAKPNDRQLAVARRDQRRQ